MLDIDINKDNWFNKVKNLLTRYGFYYVWCNESQINETHFISIFKQRLIDEYLQQWQGNINDNGVLTLYRELKTSFEFESYLDNIVSRNLRIAITKLRICSHSLRIHTGRYDRLERNVRLCQVCNSNEIEDEFHFMFKCTPYVQLRQTYIKRYYRVKPSMFKLVQLLKTQNKSEVFMLSKYISEAFKVRSTILMNL